MRDFGESKMNVPMKLVIGLPPDWNTEAKGEFFEGFVADLLRPMRLEITQRLRFTGMEIDLLAKEQDQPRTILVECKAHVDPLSADVISKLMGNATIRNADSAWLFSTSELTKDGRGQWEEIRANVELAKKFAWFPPTRICELLVDQGKVVHPLSIAGGMSGVDLGDWTLIVGTRGWLWIVEIIESGIPVSFTAFDAETGVVKEQIKPGQLGPLESRMTSLQFYPVSSSDLVGPTLERATVARVAAGDTWDDLRPSRPSDFVGRDEVISDINRFFDSVRDGTTTTRSFALQAPSGWGKSSLTLKLTDLAKRNRAIKGCSITAVDSRSATSNAFVAEAVQLAFKDAEARGLLRAGTYRVSSLQHPLRSPDLESAYADLTEKQGLIVLIFDQFEELFAKEQLFEAFNAVRELSLDLDGEQIPVLLGFAWKTDIALPQQHPAYHLWHQLSDRRITFQVPEFGVGDIKRVVSKAERALNKKLSQALRLRLIEQCQGLPWLLKKLLVHVLQRVTTPESQYQLLERELDVEGLFREDLACLPEEAIKCLIQVARAAPVAVPEVEENFSRNITNHLLNTRLIVRSGMNYVIYWDIFRDYLVEDRVPQIPWGRTFQRDPASAVRALAELSQLGSATAPQVAKSLGLKVGPTLNLLSDLVALQLVDRVAGDKYSVASVLRRTQPMEVAKHARGQLERHIIAQSITAKWDRADRFGPTKWDRFFASIQPRSSELSETTIHSYAANLRRWLLFAGLLEKTGAALHRPQGFGSRMGEVTGRRVGAGTFFGMASPAKLISLLERLRKTGGLERRSSLEREGFRNTITDALALKLIHREADGSLEVVFQDEDTKVATNVMAALKRDRVVSFLKEKIDEGISDASILSDELEGYLGTTWSESSKKRYIAGLLRFLRWVFPGISDNS